MENKDKAYIGNYPPLYEWLKKIDATCNWQVLQGKENGQHQYIECWSANGQVFLVTVRSHGNGWDIFTSGNTIDIPKTLEDAEVRLGLKGK